MTTDEINALSEAEFVARYQALFEHSPWVVAQAARLRPFADLFDTLIEVMLGADRAQQLALILAHPELAGKAAIDRTLTAESASEQASAGLDRLSVDEFDRFHALNAAYRTRFGFPFIICVRRTDKAGILAAMAQRLERDRDEEIATALAEIGEIVRLRLEDLA